jgi:serine/threonine protein kinase
MPPRSTCSRFTAASAPAAAATAAMATKIATMRTLQGHRNMLRLHHVFEDDEGFHVVVEYCKGAALLEQIHDRVRACAP